jgi:hypothetical protein
MHITFQSEKLRGGESLLELSVDGSMTINGV